MTEFEGFPKIARLNRDIVITEKIDGTNGQIVIEQWGAGAPGAQEQEDDALCVFVDGEPPAYRVLAGSRNRWVAPGKDNSGFGGWVYQNAEALIRLLGEGRHFGEWWGAGVQRRYGLTAKRFSLFNVTRYAEVNAEIGGVKVMPVPVLYRGPWFVQDAMHSETGDGQPCLSWAPEYFRDRLRRDGSAAAPGFMDPEGIVIFHEASGQLFKATIKGDDKPKSLKGD